MFFGKKSEILVEKDGMINYVKDYFLWGFVNPYILGGIDMSNMINVGGMTSYYNRFIQSANVKKVDTRTTTSSIQDSIAPNELDFLSTIDSKAEATYTEGVKKANHTEMISTKDMTLEEYKNYIHDQISSFSFCSDKIRDNYSINISEEGFKAMKNDPEYEKWVLDDLKTAFSTPMPGWARKIGGIKYQVVHYGATKEECQSTSWWTGYQGGKGASVWEAQSKRSFWNTRADRKEVQNQEKKIATKRELEKEWIQEMQEKRQVYTDFLNRTVNNKGGSGFSNRSSFTTNAKVLEIISEYEAGIIQTE